MKERERERDRDRDRQTDRQTDREREREEDLFSKADRTCKPVHKRPKLCLNQRDHISEQKVGQICPKPAQIVSTIHSIFT